MNAQLDIDSYKQADDFLASRDVSFIVEKTLDNLCPSWDTDKHIHGDEYRITFKRGKNSASLKFWNSYKDAQLKLPPTAYDVLTCINSDFIEDETTFEDWCSNFGLDTDSRKALATYTLCKRQTQNLKRIFDADDIIAMQEIQ